jgi:hypothetical protein
MPLTFADVLGPYTTTKTTTPDGTISLHGQLVLVKWTESSKNFRQYLDQAKTLKTNTKSPGYNPHLRGWLFFPTVAKAVLDTFPHFTVAPEVLAKTKTISQHNIPKPTTPPKPTKLVSFDQGKFLVRWDNVPSQEFSQALAAAQELKQQTGGYFNPKLRHWEFPKTAALKLRDYFRGFEFDTPALEQMTQAAQQFLSPQVEHVQDDTAEQLLALANQLL